MRPGEQRGRNNLFLCVESMSFMDLEEVLNTGQGDQPEDIVTYSNGSKGVD